jgi:hypothetical protein
MPTRSNVWPCDLLSVTANASMIGNCVLFKLKGRSESAGDMVIRGRNTLRPLCFPAAMTARMTLSRSSFTINIVPLHKPCRESIFFKRIKIAPILSFNSCGGIPQTWRVLRNSVGKLSTSSGSSDEIESILLYVFESPGILLMIKLLIFKQSRFFGQSMARLLILSTTSICKKIKNLNDVKLGMKSYMHYHDREDVQDYQKRGE